MGKLTKMLQVVGTVTLVTGVVAVVKDAIEDYRDFVAYDVDDINVKDAPKLYAESKINKFKEEFGKMMNPPEEDEDEDFDDFFDDEDLDSDEDASADDFDEDDFEDDEYSDESGEEMSEKDDSDFCKVTGVSRESAINYILSADDSHSEELLRSLDDGALAEIYSKLM